MYRLGRERDPEKRLALLYAVPQLAANKVKITNVTHLLPLLITDPESHLVVKFKLLKFG